MRERRPLNFDSFPTEILTEFLIRLPVGDLISARLVCKTWYLITSKPEFVELHLKYSAKHPVYLYSFCSDFEYFMDNRTISAIDKTMVGWDTGARLRQGVKSHINSSGSLLAYTMRDESFCYVCNPFTGEEIKIAMGPFWGEKDLYAHWCGFGYSVTSKEYKILLLASPYTQKRMHQFVSKGAIYTLGAGSEWREIEIPGDIPFGICYSSTYDILDFEGSLFWLVICNFDALRVPRFIVSFDVESERFKLWKSPPDADMRVELYQGCHAISLQSIGGTVALSEIEIKGNNWVVKIWMLRDKVNETWVNEINIVISLYRCLSLNGLHIIGECATNNTQAYPPCILLSFSCKTLVVYDIQNENCKFLSTFSSYQEDRDERVRYIPHIQSFVSPKRIMTTKAVPKEV